MKAVVARSYGGPELLELRDVDEPAPGDDEILVDVEASGVNFLDTIQRAGGSPVAPPFVVGLEGAGTVRAAGMAVTDVAVGDRVAWPFTPASTAELVRVRAIDAVPIPDDVSSELAAAVISQGLTAHYLATDCYGVQAGDDVLVHAAAGGVGSLLLQIARRRGARVFGTVSTEAKAAVVRHAGGEALTYDNFAEEVRKRTDGKGADVVYDGVGKATFEGSLAAVARRGYLVSYGKPSGAVPALDLQRLTDAGSIYLAKPRLADYVASREELLRRADDLFRWVASGELRVEISAHYRFDEAPIAHAELEQRRSIGKLLLIPWRHRWIRSAGR